MIETLKLSSDIFHYLGFVAFFVVSIVVTTGLQQWVISKYRNGKGNRRTDSVPDWSNKMIRCLETIDRNIVDIKHSLNNGLSDKISDVKDIVTKCHELNIIKEHDLHKK